MGIQDQDNRIPPLNVTSCIEEPGEKWTALDRKRFISLALPPKSSAYHIAKVIEKESADCYLTP